MKVVVDGNVFENTHQIGIWRVFYETMQRLSGRIEYTLWLRSRPAQAIPSGVRVIRDWGRHSGRRWDIPKRTRRAWARAFPPVRSLRHAEVFHPTYFTPGPVPNQPVVVTVYDMIAERLYPISGGWGAHDVAVKRNSILTATLCITISEASAADLQRFYPQLTGRVRVVPLGVEHLISDHGPSQGASADRPYAVFVGQRDGYKNFHTVLDALARPEWPSGVKLHVVGAPLADHEWQLIDAYGLRNGIVCRGKLSDEQLRAEFAAARCFVFPSLLEGFGLPILEAQANGCPVVCSDTPVFREVAGEGAVFFDPRLGERLGKAVAEACEPGARLKLRTAGAENVRRYSWDRCANQTLAVYEEAATLARQ